MKVLRNPTDEVLEYMAGGKNYVFEPGNDTPGQPLNKVKGAQHTDIPDAAANHLDKHLNPRGLFELTWEDSENPKQLAEKIEAALRRQKKHETKAVHNWNVFNIRQHKNERDTEDLYPDAKRWARKYGIKIDEPYKQGDEEKEAIGNAEKKAAEAEKRSKQLKSDLGEMKDMMDMLLEEKIVRDILPKYDGRSKEFIEISKKIAENDHKGALALHKKYEEFKNK